MPEPASHPEFPWSVPALCAVAALTLLRADEPLAGYFTHIDARELTDQIEEGTVQTPQLGLLVASYAERAAGGNHRATGDIDLTFGYLESPTTDPEAQDFLRLRVVDQIYRVLLAEDGALRCPFEVPGLYEEGEILTEALLEWQVLTVPRRLPASNVLLTLMTGRFQTSIHQITRRTLT